MNYLPQPAPSVSSLSVPVTELVIADIQERARVGKEKYGSSLNTFNGRSALKDAYEESQDQTQYLKQALIEAEYRDTMMEQVIKDLKIMSTNPLSAWHQSILDSVLSRLETAFTPPLQCGK